MLERNFQAKLKKELKEMFPGCIVIKNDANDIQGLPDLTIFIKTNGQLWNAKNQRTKRNDQTKNIMWIK